MVHEMLLCEIYVKIMKRVIRKSTQKEFGWKIMMFEYQMIFLLVFSELRKNYFQSVHAFQIPYEKYAHI